MTVLLVIALIICILLLAFSSLGVKWERENYNNGICPHCNVPLRFFDTDSQGGRGYTCDKCNYTTWVSYNRVDKDYRYSDYLDNKRAEKECPLDANESCFEYNRYGTLVCGICNANKERAKQGVQNLIRALEENKKEVNANETNL